MSDLNWKNSAGGDFLDPTNWDLGVAPQIFDVAYVNLPGAYKITVAAGEQATAGDLYVDDAAASLVVNGYLLVSDRIFDQSGLTVQDGSLNVVNGIDCVGPLLVDAADGSGGASLTSLTVNSQGDLVVGNADLKTSTLVQIGTLNFLKLISSHEGDDDYTATLYNVTVTGGGSVGAPSANVNLFATSFPDDSLNSTISVTGNAQLDLNWSSLHSIGVSGALRLSGSGAYLNSYYESYDFISPGYNALPLLSNAGVIALSDAASLNFTEPLNNYGVISMENGGALDFTGDLTNSGVVDINNNSPADYSVRVFGNVANSGRITVDPGPSSIYSTINLTITGDLFNTGVVNVGGSGSSADVNVQGSVTTDNGVMALDAAGLSTPTVDVTGSGVLTVSNYSQVSGGAVTVENNGAAVMDTHGTLVSATTLETNGMEFVGPGDGVSGPLIDGGELYMEAGSTLGSPVAFGPSGGLLAMFRASLPSVEVKTPNAQSHIIVFDAPYAVYGPAPTLLANNVLQTTLADGSVLNLQLDPTADYSGVHFIAQSYQGAGVEIGVAG